MNKSELIDALQVKTPNLSKKQIGELIAALPKVLGEALAAGDTVTVVGFGTFKTTKRVARVGRNPSNGKSINIAASVTPKFVAGATFKAAVSK